VLAPACHMPCTTELALHPRSWQLNQTAPAILTPPISIRDGLNSLLLGQEGNDGRSRILYTSRAREPQSDSSTKAALGSARGKSMVASLPNLRRGCIAGMAPASPIARLDMPRLPESLASISRSITLGLHHLPFGQLPRRDMGLQPVNPPGLVAMDLGEAQPRAVRRADPVSHECGRLYGTS
jgi:hypothetical protein